MCEAKEGAVGRMGAGASSEDTSEAVSTAPVVEPVVESVVVESVAAGPTAGAGGAEAEAPRLGAIEDDIGSGFAFGRLANMHNGASSGGVSQLIDAESDNKLKFVRSGLVDDTGDANSALVFDTEGGVKMMGSPTRYFEMMTKFARSSLPTLMGQIKEAAQNNDVRALHDAAHSLKGAAGFIGANAMAKSCGQLMEACPPNTSADELAHWQVQYIDELIGRLVHLYQQCKKYFHRNQAFLETYQATPLEETPEIVAEREENLRYTRGKVVLVAEDNTFTSVIIMEHLKNTHIEAHRALDGMEAVKMYTAAPQKFDLILMDCQMDVMDGYQATRVIRRWEASHPNDVKPNGVAIVGLSAYEAHAQRSMEGGMDFFATKPIGRDKLHGVIARTLRKRAGELDGGGGTGRRGSGGGADGGAGADEGGGAGAASDARAAGGGGGSGGAKVVEFSPLDQNQGLDNLGSKAFYDRMMRKFMQTDLPSSMETIRESFKGVDGGGDSDAALESMAQEAHSLKSTAGFVGARHLSEVADQMQVLCLSRQCAEAEGSTSSAEEVTRDLALCMQMLEDEYDRFVTFMSRREAMGGGGGPQPTAGMGGGAVAQADEAEDPNAAAIEAAAVAAAAREAAGE